MKTNKPMSIVFTIILIFNLGCENEDLNVEDVAMNPNLKQIVHSHTKKYDAEVATQWFSFLTNLAKVTPYNPPQSTRIFAYSSLALYESVVPGMPSYQSIYGYLTGDKISVIAFKFYFIPG